MTSPRDLPDRDPRDRDPRDRDLPDWARPVEATCGAIAALLAPHGEVVLHDLASDRIVAIWNPVSGRVPGDASLIGDVSELTDVGPYPQTLPDGRRMSAVSAVVPDAEGRPAGLLCVNVDRTPLERIAELAGTWLAPRADPPEPLFHLDWRELVGRRVGEFCRARDTTPGRLDPAARRELVAVLDGEGLFAVRRAADLVAGALGVSRATVYAHLKEIRR